MSTFSDIIQVLHNYFDTLYYCDLDKFDDVFHEHALYATADETPPLFRNMTEYRRVMTERTSPASRNEVRKDIIDNIELAGDNTASVRVRCSIGSRDFTDFLTLVKINGQWKIIAKVFQITEK